MNSSKKLLSLFFLSDANFPCHCAQCPENPINIAPARPCSGAGGLHHEVFLTVRGAFCTCVVRGWFTDAYIALRRDDVLAPVCFPAARDRHMQYYKRTDVRLQAPAEPARGSS